VYKLTRFTLQEVLTRGAETYGDRPALSMLDGPALTYRGLLERACATAAALQRLGVGRGDRVALLSENRPEWCVTYLAAAAMGAVVVPVMTEFPPVQVQNIVEHAQCRALVGSERLREKLLPATSAVPLLKIEEIGALPAAAFAFPAVAEDDLAAIIYTSGTTGQSKGVELTHGNIVSNAWATRSILRINRFDCALSLLTLAHTYECTIGFIAPILQGARIVYLDRPPSASVLLPALSRVRPTIVLTVPLIIEKICRAKVFPELEKMSLYRVPVLRGLLVLVAGLKLRKTFGGRLRFFGVGGAGLAPDVEKFLKAARFPYAIGYGLTETAPLVAGASPARSRLRSTGPALKGVSVRVADPRPGTGEGEIQVRGPGVMRGYHRDPDRTAGVFTADGWFRTGDLGVIDRQGRVYVRGRLKTMILGASGENIYPEEIEAVINTSPFVDESLVYADGSGVAALVQLKPDVLAQTLGAVQDGVTSVQHSAASLLDRIKAEVNGQLAQWSRVSKIHLQTEPFEKTPSQKIKRFLYPRRAT
jgi:long-chain acyl-CoA synthetase